jgi:hypothetical protein
MTNPRLVGFLLLLAVVASSAGAATVQYRLEYSDETGLFDLFASASSDDNAGLAAYSVALTGSILTLDHLTPSTSLAVNSLAKEGAAGFTLFRTNSIGRAIHASQDTITGGSHLLYGLGQSTGSFQQAGINPLSPATGAAWQSELRIASGRYDSAAGPLGIDYASHLTAANVFQSRDSATAMAADVVYDPRFASGPPAPLVLPTIPSPAAPPTPGPMPQLPTGGPLPAPPVVDPAEYVVEYRLELSETPGDFKLFGSSRGAGAGLAAFGVALTGPITSLNHVSPGASLVEDVAHAEGSAGFTLFRSADDSTAVHGSQDTITGSGHLLYGLGQTSGSLAGAGLTPLAASEGEAWDSDLLLATGTFDATLGTIAIDYASALTGANVFKAVGSAEVKAATVTYDSRYAFVPPAPPMPELQPPVALPEPPLSPPTEPELLPAPGPADPPALSPPFANDLPPLPEPPPALPELPNSDVPDVIVEEPVPPAYELVIGEEIKTLPIWTYDPPRWDGALVTIEYVQRPFFLVDVDGTTLSVSTSRFDALEAVGTLRSLSLGGSLLTLASAPTAAEAPIPEPTTASLTLAVVAALFVARRRP